MVPMEDPPLTVDPAPTPEHHAALTEGLSRLERALADLDDGPREAILLFHVEEMSYQDIAAALEVPIGTVMTWLHRGRAQLRRATEGIIAPLGLSQQQSAKDST